jgi:Asp-tRNA(Asn)/Glu-tRNA(Gln) amidotransferase C subunit
VLRPAFRPDDVKVLAEAARLPLMPEDVEEITHRLNAFLEALAPLTALPLDSVEPLPTMPDRSGA